MYLFEVRIAGKNYRVEPGTMLENATVANEHLRKPSRDYILTEASAELR
jgi:hypothetical protein